MSRKSQSYDTKLEQRVARGRNIHDIVNRQVLRHQQQLAKTKRKAIRDEIAQVNRLAQKDVSDQNTRDIAKRKRVRDARRSRRAIP